MRLISLHLRNIRSYEEETVAFADGITLFEGDIGSGKSTILQAIEFALFGLGDTNSSHLLRHDAKEGEVELVLDVGGSTIRLLRTLKRKRSRAQQERCVLEVDGEAEELAPADMKPRVLEVLGYDENPDPKAKSDIFRYSVYTPQEDMRTILDTRRAMREQRKKTLRRALGVLDYQQARENLALVVTEVRSRADKLEGETRRADDVRGLLDEATERLQELVNEQEVRLGELKKAEDMERTSLERVDELQTKQDQVRRVEKEAQGLETSMAQAKGRLELVTAEVGSAREAMDKFARTTERLKELEGFDEELSTLRDLERTIDQLQDHYEKAVHELADLKADLQRAEVATKEMTSTREELDGMEVTGERVDGLQRDVDDKEEEMAKLRGKVARLEDDLAHIDVVLEELTSLEGEGKCPRCKQDLTTQHLEVLLEGDRSRRNEISGERRQHASIANRLEEERDGLRADMLALKKASEERAVLERDMERLAKEASRAEMLRKRLADHEATRLGKDLDEAREGLDRNRMTELQKMEAERAVLEKETQEHSRSAERLDGLEDERREAEGALRTTENELRKAQMALEALASEDIQAALKEAMAQREGTVRVRESLRVGVEALQKEHKEASGNLSALTDEMKDLDAKLENLQALRHLISWLTGCLRPSLEEIERAVMAMMGEEMDAAARRWFELLIEDPDLEMTVDEDFVPTVNQQGYDVDVTSLSGGERTAVAFAYRLALNGLVRRVATPGQRNLLMLDEPTDGFSREQLMRMGAVLHELEADQVVIVSHDRELESFADRVYVVRKDEGVSNVGPVQ